MTPSEPQTKWDLPQCMQPLGPCRLTLGHAGDHAIEREAQGIPPAEALREALKRITDEVECIDGVEELPHLVQLIADARAALTTPPASGGIPLIDVDLLKEAHRFAAVADGDYMENVAAVYNRLAAESSPAEEGAESHEHTWVDPANEVVESNGYRLCVECGALTPPVPAEEGAE